MEIMTTLRRLIEAVAVLLLMTMAAELAGVAFAPRPAPREAGRIVAPRIEAGSAAVRRTP